MEENKFITFNKILEDALKGKVIKVRNYGEYSNWDEFEYGPEGEEDFPTSWLNNDKYVEWTGKVKELLYCDSGHFDIIFERDNHHLFPKGYLEDCYNWSLNDYLELI